MEELHAGLLNQQLYIHFANYEYRLHNTFVFNWESDFFCQSASGYFVEVEVKISRSDFFVDFKKRKHRLFADMQQKKTFSVSATDLKDRGDLLIRNFPERILSLHGYHGSYNINKRQGLRGDEELAEYDFKNGGYKVNDWSFSRVFLRELYHRDIYAPATRIHFVDLRIANIPNQYYFCTPPGLIDVTEVPSYAGLFYADNDGIKLVKKAPYLHKRKLNLNNQLLQKYYNLWRYKVSRDEKLNIQNEYNEQERETDTIPD